MAAPAQPPAEPTCGYLMSDGQHCGRPIRRAPAGVDKTPVCLMHSAHRAKDWNAFQAEINAILDGKSEYHRPSDRFDFSGFVFTQYADFYRARFTQDANFSGATFTRDADFFTATFTRDADFSRARFTQKAYFTLATFTGKANFYGATFAQDADFTGPTFTQNADFIGATFTQSGDFRGANVVRVLDFRFAKVLKDGEILLHRVNRAKEVEVPDSEAEVKPGEDPPKKKVKVGGLRVRLLNTLLERMRFEDVRWFQREGRLVLQDELDLDDPKQYVTHELVADAYRRLVNNFEKARQYEWAEQAVVGEMEMRRRNPERFLLAGWVEAEGKWFGKWFLRRWQRWIGERAKEVYNADPKTRPRTRKWARRFGEHVSSLYLYRVLSFYGTSYLRALFVLGLLLFLLFPFFLSLSGLRMRGPADTVALCAAAAPGTPGYGDIAWRCALAHHQPLCELCGTYKAGVLATFEIATLQRERRLIPAYGWGRAWAIIIVIAVPGQVALVLLALRRRFRR